MLPAHRNPGATQPCSSSALGSLPCDVHRGMHASQRRLRQSVL